MVLLSSQESGQHRLHPPDLHLPGSDHSIISVLAPLWWRRWSNIRNCDRGECWWWTVVPVSFTTSHPDFCRWTVLMNFTRISAAAVMQSRRIESTSLWSSCSVSSSSPSSVSSPPSLSWSEWVAEHHFSSSPGWSGTCWRYWDVLHQVKICS